MLLEVGNVRGEPRASCWHRHEVLAVVWTLLFRSPDSVRGRSATKRLQFEPLTQLTPKRARRKTRVETARVSTYLSIRYGLLVQYITDTIAMPCLRWKRASFPDAAATQRSRTWY